MTCYVSAERGNDLYFPEEYGRLRNFRFHRREPQRHWFHPRGWVRVKFPTWAIAQRAVRLLRQGDATLWDHHVTNRV